MMDYIFTRREVLAVTKSTSNQLQYLERKVLINPVRVEKTGKPTVLYSLGQMMAITLNKRLKNIDSDCATSLVYFLGNFNKPVDFDYAGTSLYCIGGYVSFDITDLVPDIKAVTPYTKNPSQHILAMVPDLGEILAEIIVNAKSSDVIDFDSFRGRIR
jgi:hypothetical protein